MAAAFMSVIVAIAARGPEIGELTHLQLSPDFLPVLLLARLTSPKFLAWLLPAWAAQSSRDLVWLVMLSTDRLFNIALNIAAWLAWWGWGEAWLVTGNSIIAITLLDKL